MRGNRIQNEITGQLRRLGQSDIYISALGLGCWQFSDGKGGARGTWDPIPAAEVDAIVQATLSGGINWFDTAELYGHGRSERALAGALKTAGKSDEEVVVATKWTPIGRTARSIRKTIADRQECLGDYSISLHQIHAPIALTTRKAEMNAMADLLEQGKIKSIGVSNYSAEQVEAANTALVTRGINLVSNQVRYNLLDRRIESNGVLDAAKRLGITLIAYSPLSMGLLTGKFHKDPGMLSSLPLLRRRALSKRIESSRELIASLEDIAKVYDVDAAQVALNWLVNFHGETIVAIPGASKVSQAKQNAGALSFVLSENELSLIDSLSAQFK